MGGSPPSPKPYIPAPEDRIDPEKEAAKAREETIKRRRRGLAGLITTSLLGLFGRPKAPARELLGMTASLLGLSGQTELRKRLLGE